ncbi:MAG: DUF4956 domain-containing protein [Acidobacteriota bacterium]
MNSDRERDEMQEDPLPSKEEKQHHWDEVHPTAQQAARHASSRGPTSWRARFAMHRGLAAAIILAGLVVAAVAAYLVLGRSSPTPAQPSKPASPPASQAAPASGAQPPEKGAESGLLGLFGAPASEQEREPWLTAAARITLKLALASLLAALLAFRPRRNSPLTMRNPYVAQTQILLAIVAAALMMVVSDNAARAFGIFAAASLVRFRTNIRDPKEITVLLISLAIGLGCGVGKIEVAIILSLFSLLVVSLLEYYEPEQVFRAMELTVTTRKVEETDEVLKEIFEKRNMTSELRKVDREDPDNPMGKIVYFVNVPGDLGTDKLSEEIFTSDPDNIDSVQWDQKKTSSYIYR